MVTNCWVPHCRSRWYKLCDIKFHTFPVDKKMRRLWASKIATDRIPSESSKVCSLHFTKNDYEPNSASDRVRLKKTAAPSRNLDPRTAVNLKPEVMRQPMTSFKMRIKKYPAAAGSTNGGGKDYSAKALWSENEFMVPVDPYYMYEESSESSAAPGGHSSTNPYNDPESLLQESMTEEQLQQEASMHVDSFVQKSEYEPSQPPTPPPPRHHKKRHRSSAPTNADEFQRSIDVRPPTDHQRTPKLYQHGSNKRCEAELVDGFCTYLAMQLKRLSAHLFIDVQMDVQKIVLQAQRLGLDFSLGDDDTLDDEKELSTVSASARMPNGEKEPGEVDKDMTMGNHKSSVNDEIELEYQDCQIKSEPIDDDDDYIDVHDDASTTVPDPPETPPISTAQSEPPTNPESRNPTPLPLMTHTPPPRPDQPKSATHLATDQLELNTRRLSTTVQQLLRNQPSNATTPFGTHSNTSTPIPIDAVTEDHDQTPKPSTLIKPHTDNGVLKEIVAAINNLGGAVSTLSVALNGLHLYFNGVSATKV